MALGHAIEHLRPVLLDLLPQPEKICARKCCVQTATKKSGGRIDSEVTIGRGYGDYATVQVAGNKGEDTLLQPVMESLATVEINLHMRAMRERPCHGREGVRVGG